MLIRLRGNFFRKDFQTLVFHFLKSFGVIVILVLS